MRSRMERQAMRILLVEDEIELARALKDQLARHDMVIDHVRTVSDAVAILRDRVHDVLLLDRRLPDGDGLDIIRHQRAQGFSTPVMMLSARGDLADRVEGLEQGADDYLGKPFATSELVARLRALARRPARIEEEIVRAGRLEFDFHHLEARIAGRPLVMPRRERLVLAALMRRFDCMVLRPSLMEQVFGLDDSVQSNALDSHVCRLRRKLTDAEAGLVLEGIRGVGYMLREAI